MPISIGMQVVTPNGETHSFHLKKKATVAKLKVMAQLHFDVPRSCIAVCQGSDILEDADPLVGLIDWFVISDLVDELATLEFALQLGIAIVPRFCNNCGARARNSCGRCKMTRYCSNTCQSADWRIHKLTCSAAL